MVVIHTQELHLFRELYEALILLFSQKEVIQHMRNCHTYEEWKHVIFSYIQ